jgi:hypothetical protein
VSRLTSVLVALLCLAATGSAALKTYEVVPCSNYIARAGEYEPVTQYFRNTVDSLTAVWVWVGDTVDSRMVAGSWLLVGGRVGGTAKPEGCAAGVAA